MEPNDLLLRSACSEKLCRRYVLICHVMVIGGWEVGTIALSLVAWSCPLAWRALAPPDPEPVEPHPQTLVKCGETGSDSPPILWGVVVWGEGWADDG